MSPADWAALPLRDVPVARLTWPCHDIDPTHAHNALDTSETGPIWVEQLVDGSFFVHNGRHRALRAQAASYVTIPARTLTHP